MEEIDKYCTKCKQPCDIYAEGSTHCAECFYNGNFIPATMKKKVCKHCKSPGVLNEIGHCIDCHKEMAVYTSATGDSKAMRMCPNCRKATSVKKKQCSSCEAKGKMNRSCMGCGFKFPPKSKEQRFCSNCLNHRKQKKCTNCTRQLSNSDVINERGWCDRCYDK
jgi:RecJ-like exonuclease